MKDELAKLLGKLSEVLNFLDFSFMISGSVGTMILYWCLLHSISTFQADIAKLDFGFLVFCLIVISYVLGHALGILGRGLRFCFKRATKCCFCRVFFYYDMLGTWNELIKRYDFEHCTDEKLKDVCKNIPYGDKLSGSEHIELENQVKDKYTFLWNFLYTKKEAEDRLTHINRYWGMQKMYEGLLVDALLALVLLIFMHKYQCINISNWLLIISAVSLSFIFIAFCYEANKCAKTQLEEVLSACRVF